MMQLSAVSVPVSDHARALEFYQGLLGFVIRRQADSSGDRRWSLLVPPSGTAAVALVEPGPGFPAGAAQGIMLQTLDIEHAHGKLIANGLQISGIGLASWGRYAAFQDPDGNGWLLVESRLGG